MATYIKNNVSAGNSILTDNAQTYAVMMLTGHPEYFVDRIDQSDGPWKEVARDPASHVDYMLMSTATTATCSPSSTPRPRRARTRSCRSSTAPPATCSCPCRRRARSRARSGRSGLHGRGSAPCAASG